MSVRAEKKNTSAVVPTDTTVQGALAPNAELSPADGNTYGVASADSPLKRNISVSIKASLNQLCLQKSRGTWAPTQEALRSIFQQKRFTSLDGAAENMGDLKSVVLHNMRITHVKSTFPMALGAKISGVDDCTYSATGEAFSAIVLPKTESSRVKELQADDVSLAYEFAKKFPGYTSTNLSEKGVHEVGARRFVLVAADHPIVSAISENADKLQMGEITMMPEGLVKISQTLYDSILPLVRTQVESQIKVRDFSKASVAVQPSEYASWSEARNELMVEAKRGLKAEMTSAVSDAVDEDAANKIRAEFGARERKIETELDHTPLEMHLEMEVAYNFLSK